VFDRVSLLSLRETVDHLKPSFCSLDVLSPRILKQTFDSVGTCLVSLMNKFLSTGTIPDKLKQAPSESTITSNELYLKFIYRYIRYIDL